MAGSYPCDGNATCVDTVGAHTCTCNTGYTGNGTQCFDADECSTGESKCDDSATCTNSAGSFTCECNDGFQGNGTLCTRKGAGSNTFTMVIAVSASLLCIGCAIVGILVVIRRHQSLGSFVIKTGDLAMTERKDRPSQSATKLLNKGPAGTPFEGSTDKYYNAYKERHNPEASTLVKQASMAISVVDVDYYDDVPESIAIMLRSPAAKSDRRHILSDDQVSRGTAALSNVNDGEVYEESLVIQDCLHDNMASSLVTSKQCDQESNQEAQLLGFTLDSETVSVDLTCVEVYSNIASLRTSNCRSQPGTNDHIADKHASGLGQGKETSLSLLQGRGIEQCGNQAPAGSTATTHEARVNDGFSIASCTTASSMSHSTAGSDRHAPLDTAEDVYDVVESGSNTLLATSTGTGQSNASNASRDLTEIDKLKYDKGLDGRNSYAKTNKIKSGFIARQIGTAAGHKVANKTVTATQSDDERYEISSAIKEEVYDDLPGENIQPTKPIANNPHHTANDSEDIYSDLPEQPFQTTNSMSNMPGPQHIINDSEAIYSDLPEELFQSANPIEDKDIYSDLPDIKTGPHHSTDEIEDLYGAIE
ncbi:uncharacterized protein LOC135819778 [Sycon ciliatum]|uniref:uncharacterized protein LOC135819778 n=1 Tax=Sycon ciliatum TaxID=27933 RepID=UPI0031F6396D